MTPLASISVVTRSVVSALNVCLEESAAVSVGESVSEMQESRIPSQSKFRKQEEEGTRTNLNEQSSALGHRLPSAKKVQGRVLQL